MPIIHLVKGFCHTFSKRVGTGITRDLNSGTIISLLSF